LLGSSLFAGCGGQIVLDGENANGEAGAGVAGSAGTGTAGGAAGSAGGLGAAGGDAGGGVAGSGGGGGAAGGFAGGSAGGQAGGAAGGAAGAGGMAVPSARMYFETNVRSILVTACADCHDSTKTGPGPDFLGAGEVSYWAQLKADPRMIGATPQTSLLVTKGAHTGRAFTASEEPTVATWILMEAATAGAGGMGAGGAGGTTGGTAMQALTRFGNCMTLTDFTNSNIADLANQNSTQGRCFSCHSTGTGGAYLGVNANDTYMAFKMMPYILKLASTTVNPDGSVRDIVASNRMRDKGQEGGQHPQYVLTAARQQAIEQFFRLTYQRWSSGVCQ
jgi:cytochrome c553